MYLIATMWSVKPKVGLLNSCAMVQCTPLGVFIDTTNGNVSHFVSAMECVLHKIDTNRTTILAGDINIDIIKFCNEDVVSYVSTLMSFKYLPYITVPSRITQLSTTCIDHMFMKNSKKDWVLNAISGLFYCEITDVFYLLILKNTTERMRGQWPEFLVRKIVPKLECNL